MSLSSCPVSGQNGSTCPSGRIGPRGCAFAAFQPNLGTSTAYTNVSMCEEGRGSLLKQGQNSEDTGALYDHERKALNEMLMPEAPARNITKGLKNADGLQPEDNELLAFALGAPARAVLNRAEQIGPQTGWKDGYLSSSYGCK